MINLLGESQLQQLAGEQLALEQNLKRRQEAADQQRTQQQEQRQNSQSSSGGGAAPPSKLQVEIIGKNLDVDGLLRDSATMAKLTRLIVSEINRSGRMAGYGGG